MAKRPGRRSKGARHYVPIAVDADMYSAVHTEASQRGLEVSDFIQILVGKHVGRNMDLPPRENPVDEEAIFRIRRLRPDQRPTLATRLPLDLYDAFRQHVIDRYGDSQAESHRINNAAAVRHVLACHFRSTPHGTPAEELVTPLYQQELLMPA